MSSHRRSSADGGASSFGGNGSDVDWDSPDESEALKGTGRPYGEREGRMVGDEEVRARACSRRGTPEKCVHVPIDKLTSLHIVPPRKSWRSIGR